MQQGDLVHRTRAHRLSDCGRRILAAVPDFRPICFGGGDVTALMAGRATAKGLALTGLSALVLFAPAAACFVGMNRDAGGAIFRHVPGMCRASRAGPTRAVRPGIAGAEKPAQSCCDRSGPLLEGTDF